MPSNVAHSNKNCAMTIETDESISPLGGVSKPVKAKTTAAMKAAQASNLLFIDIHSEISLQR